MNSQERTIVSSLVVLMILLWLGFLWHRDPSIPRQFYWIWRGFKRFGINAYPIGIHDH